MDRVVRYYPPRCLHELQDHVLETLRHPANVFWGLRDGDPDPGAEGGGWCYSQAFDQKYDTDGRLVAVPKGQVFCVYLNDKFEVFEFRWDTADQADPTAPQGANGARFKGRSK